MQAAADALGEIEDMKEQLAAALQAKSLAEREVQRASTQLDRLRSQQAAAEAEASEVGRRGCRAVACRPVPEQSGCLQSLPLGRSWLVHSLFNRTYTPLCPLQHKAAAERLERELQEAQAAAAAAAALQQQQQPVEAEPSGPTLAPAAAEGASAEEVAAMRAKLAKAKKQFQVRQAWAGERERGSEQQAHCRRAPCVLLCALSRVPA